MRFVRSIGLVIIISLILAAGSLLFAQEGINIPVTDVRIEETSNNFVQNPDDPLTLMLERGRTGSILAAVFPADATNKDISWESTDPRIATVQATGDFTATVTARAAGTVNIIVYQRQEGVQGFPADSLRIEVFVPISSLSIDKREADLAVNEDLILNVSVVPNDTTNQELIWSSTNPGVATVKEIDPTRTTARNPQAVVTAHREGEARIIVRSIQNESINSACLVTVTKDGVTQSSEGTEAITTTDTPAPVVPDNGTVISENDLAESPASTNFSLYIYLGIGLVIFVSLLAFYLANRNRGVYGISGASVKGVSGHFSGQNLKLVKGQLIFGRDAAEAQVAYPQTNSRISRKHCTLKYDKESSSYILIDTSSNGTFLANGVRLDEGKPYLLKPNEKFYLADPEEMFEVL